MSTRAIQILEQKKIPFEVVKYNHEEKGAKFASKASGLRLELSARPWPARWQMWLNKNYPINKPAASNGVSNGKL